MKKINEGMLEAYKKHLWNDEKAEATIEKYLRDVTEFFEWYFENFGEREITKEAVLAYKNLLCEQFAPASVNAALSSLNSFFSYMDRFDLRVKSLKIQRQIFSSDEKELTKREYERLLCAAQRNKNERLYYLMQTICSTGIRVSELKFITVEAVLRGVSEINCKGKLRRVFLPRQLCKLLAHYTKKQKIKRGPIFRLFVNSWGRKNLTKR
ncbi:MAG: integrase [Ruminococcaceae bacterium]|nr:integrase [Oscillospiraceae bacterium]